MRTTSAQALDGVGEDGDGALQEGLASSHLEWAGHWVIDLTVAAMAQHYANDRNLGRGDPVEVTAETWSGGMLRSAPIFVTKMPRGYRDWKWISVAHEAGNFNSIGATLGNVANGRRSTRLTFQ